MRNPSLKIILFLCSFCAAAVAVAGVPEALRVGVAGHAFDHLGDIGGQAEAAAASGANIIYCSGLGALGYQGLPSEAELEQARAESLAYVKAAKSHGIRLAIGYVCATSMVGLDKFDKNWTPKFRAQFHSPPAQWRQQDRNGNALRSWYGGNYEAACMNNPDWRAYEKGMVRLQLEAGQDGVFFDNPTVHPDGCYCRFCMEKFGAFLATNGHAALLAHNNDVEAFRKAAADHPREFMEFRAGIARDFLADMKSCARGIHRRVFITCNNSLNAPDAFFAQCRRFAYDIEELSQAEDWITVEDMATQPRLLADGRTVEYGPVYRMLRAISQGKPVVAVTLADADYHTPPNLARLAMAEAAANGASYLSWPTWPEPVRQKMAASLRPEADFLRANEKSLNDLQPRSDALVLLSFQRWLETENCAALGICAALARSNIQFTVLNEAEFESVAKKKSRGHPVLIIEQFSTLNAKERQSVAAYQKRGGRVVETTGPDWMGRFGPGTSRRYLGGNAEFAGNRCGAGEPHRRPYLQSRHRAPLLIRRQDASRAEHADRGSCALRACKIRSRTDCRCERHKRFAGFFRHT